MKKNTCSAPIPAVDTFRDDPLFPRVARAVAAILAKGKVVAPVDVLVGMDLLAPERLEAWRRGRVPYLERVINGSARERIWPRRRPTCAAPRRLRPGARSSSTAGTGTRAGIQ